MKMFQEGSEYWVPYFKKEDMESVFNEVYEKKKWGSFAGGSGDGSLPEYANHFRNILSNLITNNNIETVVDFGCGSWEVYKDYKWPQVDYTGIDIADIPLKKAKKNCSIDSFKFIKETDYNNIPSADLLIVKEVFQHWPDEHITDFFENNKSKFKYIYVVGEVKFTLPLEIEKMASYAILHKHEKPNKEHLTNGYWIFK